MSRFKVSLITVATLLLTVAYSLEAESQESDRVTEPEYTNVFLLLNPADASLVPLERHTPVSRSRSRAISVVYFLEVPEENSAVRVSADSTPDFVVRVASRDRDPLSLVQFFVWSVEKGKRTLWLGEKRDIGSNRSGTGKSEIKFTATKYGTASFKVTPASPLRPGEYMLSTHDSADAFFFGVDPKKPE